MKSLMIGDFVTFKDCQHDEHPTIVKIWQINGDNEAFVYIDENDALDEITIDDEIVGIPITPEILEKNGFFIGNYGEYWMGKEKGESVNMDKDNYAILEKGSSAIYLTCEYVHQLQHALKICGIDKEIVL